MRRHIISQTAWGTGYLRPDVRGGPFRGGDLTVGLRGEGDPSLNRFCAAAGSGTRAMIYASAYPCRSAYTRSTRSLRVRSRRHTHNAAHNAG